MTDAIKVAAALAVSTAAGILVVKIGLAVGLRLIGLA